MPWKLLAGTFCPVGALEDGAPEVHGESLAADDDGGLIPRCGPMVDALLQGHAGGDHRLALGEEDPARVRGLAASRFKPSQGEDRDGAKAAGRGDHGREHGASPCRWHWTDGNRLLRRVDC